MTTFLCFTLFVVLSLIFATAPLPLMLFRPFDPRNALVSARLLGLRWTVRGIENVDDTRGAVILLNHQSGLDFSGSAVAPDGPLYGDLEAIATVPGAIRDGGLDVGHGVHRPRSGALCQRKLLLFPEGTRHSGDKLLPFRKGAFHVAIDAGAPIQPVVISKYHFLDAKRRRFGSGDIIITILPSISTDGVDKDNITSLVETTQSKMQEVFTRTSAETRPYPVFDGYLY
ncbi:unnamed protein product [Leptidea sinapis]|uniref:1-acylglycerol-3-phosphate O-acyltransferase n=1 Tax=Leptidea sinapis TaxID=189913 RepID=A0A5E4Q455_9NEOP|nr:unnamed protein product [Leptidea sinapis]